MKKFCIIGGGGTAKELLSLIGALNSTLPESEQWVCIGLLDDNDDLKGSVFCGFPVIGKLADAVSLNADVSFAFAVGSPRTVGKRRHIFEKMGIAKERCPSFVHPQSMVPPAYDFGYGTIVFPGAVVSDSATMKDFIVVLSNSVVNHDSVVGAFTCLATGACISGGVRIGIDSYIGANAALRDGIEVGEGSLVGMGSVVISSIPPGSVAYGVPAIPKPMKP